VNINGGDIVVADEEGIVVTPSTRHEQVLLDAQAKQANNCEETLDAWEQAHRARIDAILTENGFEE
jgi:4-hydroxy-4-methyl-2-oxoglutarate aldolase